MLKDWGYTVREEAIAIEFLMESGKNGQLEEAFGTGTAAVISPIGSLRYKGDSIEINNFKTGDLTQKIYDNLTEIQWGNKEDIYNWTVEVK